RCGRLRLWSPGVNNGPELIAMTLPATIDRRYSMKRYFVAFCLLIVTAVTASAQKGGTVEIGLVIKEAGMDASFKTTGGTPWLWGASLRVGIFLSPRWELEADDAQVFGHTENFFKGYAQT